MKKLFTTLLLLTFLFPFAMSQTYNMTGAKFDQVRYRAYPLSAPRTIRVYDELPSSFSLKAFAPTPGHQGKYGTCAAWAVAYAARTILAARDQKIVDKTRIDQEAFSPGFLYAMSRGISDTECSLGIGIMEALDKMRDVGAVKKTDFSKDCAEASETTALAVKAAGFKIADYNRLYRSDDPEDIKVKAVKLALTQNNPVILGMHCENCGQSLNKPTADVWSGQTLGGEVHHAITVVGYDDTKEGGSFETMNSWGTTWGQGGFLWVKYADFARYALEGYEMMTLKEKRNTQDLAGSFRLVNINNEEIKAGYNLPLGAPKLVNLRNSQYKIQGNVAPQTRYRLLVNNNESAYVYVLGGDKTSEVNVLFPYTNESGEAISAALNGKNNEIAFPDENHAFEATREGGGTDYLAVIYSKEELDINALTTQMAQTTGNFAQKLATLLKDKLVADRDVVFDKGKVSFTAKSNDKKAVLMILEMDIK